MIPVTRRSDDAVSVPETRLGGTGASSSCLNRRLAQVSDNSCCTARGTRLIFPSGANDLSGLFMHT